MLHFLHTRKLENEQQNEGKEKKSLCSLLHNEGNRFDLFPTHFCVSVCLCMCLFVCRLSLFEFECRLLVPLAVRTTLDLNLPHWTWAVTDRSSCSLTSLPHLDTASQHVSLAHKTSFEYFTFLFFATDPVGAESRHCRTSTRNRVLYLCPSLTDRMWSLWTYTDHQSLPH